MIRPLESPCIEPISLSNRIDSRFRLCINYNALKENTIVDSYPLLRIDELLSRLYGAKYFYRLDLYYKHFYIPSYKYYMHKIAFFYRYGTCEYLIISFRITNAPGTLYYIMNEIFFNMVDKNILVYLHDIIIFTKDK